MFTTVINDFFLIDLEAETCSVTDDKTIFRRGNNLEDVVTKMKDDLQCLPKVLEHFL